MGLNKKFKPFKSTLSIDILMDSNVKTVFNVIHKGIGGSTAITLRSIMWFVFPFDWSKERTSSLLHCSTVIVDDQSSDDNKLEVGTFLLDVLSLSRQCRKLMRQSKYWIDVEQVLNWCHCNDVLFLKKIFFPSGETITQRGLSRLVLSIKLTWLLSAPVAVSRSQ